MQRLEVSGAVRPIYGSLGVKRLSAIVIAKSDYQLRHVSLSVRPQGTTRLSLEGFS